MRKRILGTVGLLLSVCVCGCGDEGGGQAVDVDVSDTGDSGGDVGDVGPDGDDLDATGDLPPWFDGGYADGLGEPVEHCSDGADNDNDGDADCADADCDGRLACAGALEAEAEPNDRREDAQELTLPAIVAGNIEAYTEDDEGNRSEDYDWYTFTVAEPTLIDWELDDVNGPALPICTLFGLEDATAGVVRQLDIDTPGLRRQTWLPVAGRYGIEVRDRRNTRRSGDEFPYGGPLFDYVMRVTPDVLVPETINLPIEQGLTALGAGNALPIFAIELAAGQVFESELWAERLSPSSGLDAMLYLVNRADNAVITFLDDAPLGTYDPLIRTTILGEDVSAWLIVDAFRIDHTASYELFAGLVAPSIDREPNNPVLLAYPSEVGATIEGEISKPFMRFRSTVTDSDFYLFPGGRQASYTITVTPTGEALDAVVRTGNRYVSRGVWRLAERFQADPADERGVRLEATSMINDWLVVEVADRRNILDDEAEPVGGADFGYDLEVELNEREVATVQLPVAQAEELTGLGETDWYRFDTPGRVRLEVTATEQSEGFEPYVYLTYDDDALLRRASRSFYHLNNVDRPYRVAVVDRRAGGGESYDYDLTIEAVPLPSMAEQEPNDGPPVGGQVISELPVWVDAVLTGTNQDEFDTDVFVVNLEAGEAVTIETAPGTNLETNNADTVVALSGPGLSEPIVDNNGGYWNASRIADFVAPEAGAFEISVTPWCNEDLCLVGDYGLSVWSVPAPPDDEQ